MDYEKQKNTIKIKLTGDFIYPNVVKIEKLLEDIDEGDLDTIFIDLTQSKIVGSEAVKFLYKLKNRGFKIKLKNVPEIYYEVLKILELENYFKDVEIVNG
jgi:anti-anti-sigma regulatory factor